MNGILKAMFRRGSALLLAVILLAQLVPVMTAKAADTDLAATVEEQIRAFADSIDKTNADDAAANALAKHGLTGGGKKLSVGKSHALTAVLFNSELLQNALIDCSTAAVEYMQRLDLDALPYTCGGANWYGSDSSYWLHVYNSDEYEEPQNLETILMWVGKYSDTRNSYDNGLDWMAAATTLVIGFERIKVTDGEAVYKVTCTVKDRFDFNTGSNSGFKNLISGLGALLFQEFNWESNVTFKLTVPYSCTHSSGNYHWTYDAENHTFHADASEGFIVNKAEQIPVEDSKGAVSYYHKLETPVRLLHEKPWEMEFTTEKPWYYYTLSPVNTTATTLSTFGGKSHYELYIQNQEWINLTEEQVKELGTSTAYYIYHHGTQLSSLFEYKSGRTYTFHLKNVISYDGSNMIWLTVRDNKLDEEVLCAPLDDYSAKASWEDEFVPHNESSDWVSGKDFYINYFGNQNLRFLLSQFDLRIWENGEGAEAESLCTKKVTKPTCTAKGYTTYTCTACGYSWKGDTTKAKGHSYKANVTAPTCTTDGYTTYTCSACKDCYTANRISAPGHTLSAGLCTTCGEDTLTAALNGNTLTLSGELDEGTKVIAACYDSSGRFSGTKLFVWQGSELTEEIPGGETVRLFFLDENWSPLRQLIPLS